MMYQYFYGQWVDLRPLTQALSVACFIIYQGVYGTLLFKDILERNETVEGEGGC